jgi:hypothetical protein
MTTANVSAAMNMSQLHIDPDKAIDAYTAIEDELATARKDWERREAALKEKLERLKSYLAHHLTNVAKVSSCNVNGKTVYFETVVKPRVKDWHAYHQFVAEQGQLTLLQKRVSEKELATWIKEHGDAIPPGVDIETRRELRLRTSKTKS